ncbi:MAG: hypothetical protein D6B26_02575, partial [Spirochaetaceae bacterium]
CLHRDVRREYWGYSPNEELDVAALLAEDYQGIRPAPGYPPCPNHEDKAWLWELLQADTHAGISLTESWMMKPAAAVSGLYLSHPQACYFDVGKINRDQVSDWANRKGLELSIAQQWLAPKLGYLE